MAREGIQIGSHFLTPEQFRSFIGFNHFMLEEAIASVALDHDSRARTVNFDELTPEQQAEVRDRHETISLEELTTRYDALSPEQQEELRRGTTRDGDPETD